MKIPTFDEMDDAVEGLLELFEDEDSESLVDLIKASFGGDRSAAGRYAAEQRWKGHQKKDKQPKGRASGSLDDEVARVSGMLRAVANLPITELGTLAEIKTITPEEYDSYDKAQFVWVSSRGGKRYLVVTKPVMEAEAAVRAVGSKVLQQVHQDLVASGKVTQQDLDDATMFMSREVIEENTRTALEQVLDRAMDGDTSLPPQVLEEAKNVQQKMEAAKEAKSKLLMATRAYNKFVEKGNEIRLSGRRLTDEEREQWNEMERQLWRERRAAKAANQDAKLELKLAQRNLEQWASSEAEVETQVTDYKEEERLKQNAIRVQGIVGDAVRELLGSRRVMAGSVPMRDIIVSGATFIRDGKQVDPHGLARDLLAETRRRFPEALMGRLDRVNTGQGGVKIVFTASGGGSYNELQHTIQADLDDSDTITHEMVHGISYNSQETRLMEQAALQRRVFGKVDQPDAPFWQKVKIGLQKIVGATKALGWRFSGSYVEDKFMAGYQGRIYDYQEQKLSQGRAPKNLRMTGATEILTVSTENVFGGGYLFRKTGKLDVDLMHLALGWLLSAEGGK